MSIPRNLGNFADNVNTNGKVEVTGINATGTPSASTALLGNGTWGTVTTSPAGSTGQVQYNNAGAFGAISSGTSGQVLTSAGSGSAPTWATPAGGAWTYLSTVTASNAATVNIENTFDSTYDMYAIVAVNMRPSASASGYAVRLKIGGVYQTDSNYCFNTQIGPSNSSAYSGIAYQNNIGFMLVGYGGIGSSSTDTGSYVMYIPNPSSTSTLKTIYWSGYATEGITITKYDGAGLFCNSIEALTGVRFFVYSSGNITGTFRLYGIKNS